MAERAARDRSGETLRRLLAAYNGLYTPPVRRVEQEAMAYFERGDVGGMLKFLALKQEDRGSAEGNQYGAWWRLQTIMLADPANRLLRAYLDWLRRERAYYWSEPEVFADERLIEAFLASDGRTGRQAR